MKFSRSLYLLLAANVMLLANVFAQSEPATTVSADKIAPVEVYGALPGARSARLSPNGKLLALIVPVRGRDTLVVWDVEGKIKPAVIQTGEFEPEWFVWKSDKRLITALRFFSMRDSQHPTADTRLIALDADGSHQVVLVNADLFQTYIPQLQDKIVSMLPNDENHILLELPAIRRDATLHNSMSGAAQYGSLETAIKYPEVVRADVNTGQLAAIRISTAKW